MTSLTLSMPEDFKNKIRNFLWVNWSEVAREEAVKKLIFEKYLKTKEISDEEWKFCERIDWHPVDELPLREEFIKKLDKIKKGKFRKYSSVGEFFEKIK